MVYAVRVTIRDSFFLAHRVYYKTDPSPLQMSMYESFPTFRGVSDETGNEEVLRAVLIMSLVQTYPKGQQSSPFRCYLFLSPHLQDWTLKHIETYTKEILCSLRKDRKFKLIKQLGIIFPGIYVGGRTLQILQPPERWACFGFKIDGILPEWMRSSLFDASKGL